IHISFKYARDHDIDIIKSINPAYATSSDHVLIIFENEVPTGYVAVGKGKDNYIADEYLHNVSAVFDKDKLKKIINDAINCCGDGYHIKKHVCGVSVDPILATPINMPNR